ncbi:MAG: putative acyltransferase [Verrucomicrobiales bacterium]
MNDNPPKAQPKVNARLLSLDTYRGLVLLLLCIEVPNWDWHHTLAHAFPDNGLVQWIAHHTGHIDWQGGGLWDLIQPSFMFMVGVSMAYSRTRFQTAHPESYHHDFPLAHLLVDVSQQDLCQNLNP